jgi:predicted DNA-binding mobile mystery protein A
LLNELQGRFDALNGARRAAARPARGWLRAIREAIGLTQGEVADKMTVKRQSYAQLETAEEKESITLASMRRAAEAMDCELVCFLLPRESLARSYEELAVAHDPSAAHLKATEHSMSLRGRGVQPDAG